MHRVAHIGVKFWYWKKNPKKTQKARNSRSPAAGIYRLVMCKFELYCYKYFWLFDWLIIYGFTSRSRIFSLIWRRHHCRWRAAKFRPMLCAQGLWAGRDLYRTTPAVTQGLGFSGLIRSRLSRYTRGCGGSILTRILKGFDCLKERITIDSQFKNENLVDLKLNFVGYSGKHGSRVR
jgi:hypothetical protein